MNLRWGLLAAGTIAAELATGIKESETGELAAVAARSGDRAAEFAARFGIRSTNVRWARDSGFTSSTIGDLIWRTVSGISNLDVEARLSGALHHPNLAVRSNLDQAIASRLRAVLGEQVAAAEKQVRDRVDSLINDKVGPVRARVNEVQSQAQAQVAQQRARLDELQKQLEQRLRELTGIRLP